MLKFSCSEGRSASGVSSDAGSSVERTVSFGVASSSRTDVDMFCQNFILNYGRKDGKKDEGDDNGSSESEDFEVHIDLTDDLLHMVHIEFCFFFHLTLICRYHFILFLINFFVHQVFSFLNHIDLCRSAMVCHQ